jgi:4-amino-4-deoxy-L-arabinose transferase-like glycosyltransferase
METKDNRRPWLGLGRSSLILLGLMAAYRVILAAVLPLGTDEAYAVSISRVFALSYFDHPPLHFWLIGLWQGLVGVSDTLVLRLPFIALGLGAALLVALTAKRLFGEGAAVATLALLAAAPVFSLAHGLMILPDGPLLFAEALVAYGLVPLALRENGLPLRRWVMIGVAAGLAILSKYHGVLLVGGAFIFLLGTAAGRRDLRRVGPWLAAGIALLMSLPILIWNAENAWASFAFQSGRSHLAQGIDVLALLTSIAAQAVYLAPWIAVPLALTLIATVRRGPAERGGWLLVSLATPIIGFFTAAALFGGGLPHWQMPGWFLVLPLLGAAMARRSPTVQRLVTGGLISSALLIGALGLAIGIEARTGVFDTALSAAGLQDPTDDLMDWGALRAPLLAAGADAPKTFIAATSWIDAARLGAALGDRWPVLCLCRDARHFAYAFPPARYAGWTGFMVLKVSSKARNDQALEARFAALSPAADIGIRKGNRLAVPLDLRIGTGFRP